MESPEDIVDNADFEKQKQMLRGKGEGEGKVKGKGDDDAFDETKEEDDELKEKLNAIEKKIEEKLTQLDHTFGNVHQETYVVLFVKCYFLDGSYMCWN